MSGEFPLATREYPDDVGFQVLGPFAAADLPIGDTNVWITDDRDIVIDKVTGRMAVDADAATCNIVLEHEGPGVAVGSGTAFTVAANIGSTTGVGALTNFDLTLVNTDNRPTENIIPAGSAINVNLSAASTGLDGLFLHIRYRSKKR
jgi:hypothetical protein